MYNPKIQQIIMTLNDYLYLQSDNLQYNTLGQWVDCLIDQTSDGPSIILIDAKLNGGLLAWT